MSAGSVTKRDGWRQRVLAQDGATLLEVLIVLLILGFIATLGSIQLVGYFSRARVDTAKLQMNELSVALDLFRLDAGRYPRQEEGLRALIAKPEALSNWRGPYLKRDTLLNDPWSRPYLYQSRDGGGSFAISTLGSDGVAGGTDDKADLVVSSAP
jgi:general secretion pathway protein G